MVNFNLQIKSEYSFYVFTTEIYNFWKDDSFLKGITLPKDYNYNGVKGKMMKEREFKKIYHAINKIYNGICSKIETEVMEKKKKELEAEFTRKGQPFKNRVKKLEKKGVWNNATKMMDPDVYKWVEEETADFKTKWNKILMDKNVILSDDDTYKKAADRQQRVNSVLNVYLTRKWEDDEVKGDFGDGSDKAVKERCALCRVEGPDNYKTAWKRYKEDKSSSTGIEIPYFCSYDHLYQWLQKNLPDGEFTRNTSTPKSKIYADSGKKYARCVNCFRVSTEGEFMNDNLNGWKKSKSMGMFCSQKCLDQKKAGGGNKRICAQCGREQKKGEFAGWDVTHGVLLCSDPCTQTYFKNLRQTFIQKLRDLSGWSSLSAAKQTDFINQINTGIPGKFDDIIEKAKIAIATGGTHPYQSEIDDAVAEIQDELDKDPKISSSELESQYQNYSTKLKSFALPHDILGFKNQVLQDIQEKRDAKNDTSDPLARYKGDAISAIDSAFLGEPEVKLEELEVANRNFVTQINAVDSKAGNARNQIDAIKSNVLANIQKIRESKTKNQGLTARLKNLRTEAINLIHQELKRKPALSESDISNHNWKADLAAASEESEIVEIRDKVLADIKTKRAGQQVANKVTELLERAKTADTFEALGAIITELQNYHSSEAYQQHQAEIEALEIRLQKLDPGKYQKQIGNDLEQQIQSQGLTFSELNTDTQKSVEQAKRSGSPADKKLAGEKVAFCGAQVNLDKLLAKASVALTKSQLERTQLAAEIETFIKQDPYKKAIYQKNRPQVDRLLNQLRGKQQKQIPTSPKSTWPKTLGIGALIVVPVSLVIIGIIFHQRRMKQRRRG